ncbi:MAG: hypothetical protein KA479_09560 [Saprospiraceae bacterium]|nr:hypothetical protein [Saprospiraceae bacterium]
MANRSTVTHRDFPPYFLHPRHNDQLDPDKATTLPSRFIEAYESKCNGHILTQVHLVTDAEHRRYLVEVQLETGTFWIEAPCTYMPVLGMDIVDGNLVLDAEEWILVQQLRLKSRRLARIFGPNDRVSSEEYIRQVTAAHAGLGFQDVEPEFEQNESESTKTDAKESGKKWWRLW